MSFKSISWCQPILFPFNPCNSVTREWGGGGTWVNFCWKGIYPILVTLDLKKEFLQPRLSHFLFMHLPYMYK